MSALGPPPVDFLFTATQFLARGDYAHLEVMNQRHPLANISRNELFINVSPENRKTIYR